MFVDLHCHIIPNIDDGAEDWNMALQMSRIAVNNDIKHIVTTPHYIHQELENDSQIIEQNLRKFKKILKENNIELFLYPGCEVFICLELPELLREGKVCTLNNTFYVLLELPMMSIPEYTEEIIYELKLMGYTPIIAHPERNEVIRENPETLKHLIELGALTQINTTSIRGIYGKKTKEFVSTLLKCNMVHLVSSDAHTTRGRSPKYGNSKEIMLKLIGEKETLKIFNNAKAVLGGQEIDIPEPILPAKSQLWRKIGEIGEKVSTLLSLF